MPRAKVPQVAFNVGEVSDKAYGRIDIEKYFAALRQCVNCYIHAHGPVSNRSGFRYLGPCKTHDTPVILVPFEYSDDQTYALEFGHKYVRFWSDRGQLVHIVRTYNKTAWATATAYVIGDERTDGTSLFKCIQDHTSAADNKPEGAWGWEAYWELVGRDSLEQWVTATEYKVQDMRWVAGISYICNEDHTSGTWATDLAANKWTQQDEVEIASPFPEQTLKNMRWAQSADVMFLVDGARKPRKLTRLDHQQWQMESMDFDTGVGCPGFQAPNEDTDLTMDASALTGTITVIASKPIFTWDHQYAYLRMHNGFMRINTVDSDTQVTCIVRDDLEAHTATSEWAWGGWGGKFLWPRHVELHDDRLVFAGTIDNPLSVWMSKTGSYTDFSMGDWKDSTEVLTDDDGIFRNIQSGGKQNDIQWILSGSAFMVGSLGTEFSITGANLDAITPTSWLPKNETAIGSSRVQPIQVGNHILFVQKHGKKLMDWVYHLEAGGRRDFDRTVMADHITRYTEITSLCYQQSPNKIVWVVLSDGTMAGLTHMREHDVYGWHRHHTPNGLIESACSIAGTEEDDLYVVVSRYINGAWVRNVECLDPYFKSEHSIDAFFLDSGLSYEEAVYIDGVILGATTQITVSDATKLANDQHIRLRAIIGFNNLFPDRSYIIKNLTGNTFDLYQDEFTPFDTSTWTGSLVAGLAYLHIETQVLGNLGHLEGETVSLLVNGAVHPDRVVSGGQVTLTHRAWRAEAGLNFDPYIELMDQNDPENPRRTFGTAKRIVETRLRLKNTLGVQVGPALNNLKPIKFRDSSVPMGEIRLFTGLMETEFDGDFDLETSMYIVQAQPLPMTISSLMNIIETEE